MFVKKYLVVSAVSLLIVACNATEKGPAQQTEKISYYGDTITTVGDIIPVAQLDDMMVGKDSLLVKVSGTIEECCKKKGCFMTLRMDDNSLLTVRFKDYGFFVPKDADGLPAIFEGVARREVIDVETLRHLASDKGASQEEIDAITQPEESITFEAHGVIIKGYEPKKAS